MIVLGYEDDAVIAELEAEGDGEVARNVRDRSRG